MSLLNSEVSRIKTELGFNELSLSALPYAIDGITQLFTQVVQPYLNAGELNHSSTALAVQSTPTLVTLTLNGPVPTAMLVGDRIVVDQDSFQEFAHATAVTSNTVTLALQNAHNGTFPLTVEGGESTARYCLRQCISIADRIGRAASRAGVQKADEVTFFASTATQNGVIDDLIKLQRHWRNELASALGVANLREGRKGGGGAGALVESY